jgi:hypothetical protein
MMAHQMLKVFKILQPLWAVKINAGQFSRAFAHIVVPAPLKHLGRGVVS